MPWQNSTKLPKTQTVMWHLLNKSVHQIAKCHQHDQLRGDFVPRLNRWPGSLPLDPPECFALRFTLQRLLRSLVFVQKFILMKMHKNCSHQSCSFWLRYAPNRLSAGALPQTPMGELTALPRLHSWYRGWGLPGKGKEWGRGKGRMGGDGRESRNAQIQSWQA